jgi:CRP-like cAMP-binding protein
MSLCSSVHSGAAGLSRIKRSPVKGATSDGREVFTKPIAPSYRTPDPRSNQLLGALSDPEFRRLSPALECVELPLGQVLYETGSTVSHAYFPATAVVSLLYESGDGGSVETAITGNEGIVGIAAFTGGESMLGRAVVLSAGYGFRLEAHTLKDELRRSDSLMHLLLRYTQALITQMAQTAVCNRRHSLEQQLCRWLLQIQDRLQGADIAITQEVIAGMLGVRRGGVTEAALKLQKVGLIHHTRGHIEVIDRAGLEQRTCECYAVVKTECDRLLPTRAARWPAVRRDSPRVAAGPICSFAH